MFLLLFGLWIIFNGRITLEVVILGLLITAFVYIFMCKFMNFTPKTELLIARHFFWGILYIIILLYEIFVANILLVRLIILYGNKVKPSLIYFRTDLKSDFARVVLAHSITLTPGTITVSLRHDVFCVHCLHHSLAEGIDQSVFVRMLRKMESK